MAPQHQVRRANIPYVNTPFFALKLCGGVDGGVDRSLCVGLNKKAVPNTGLPNPGTGLDPEYM